ncbi:MAG: TonB family protein [Thermodesulfobacteriota bacterium]|nr:TonB family protein [Thermodesulfobacteriota bacterium]
MKRFLLAAALALFLHGILLSVDARWMKKMTIQRSVPEIITLSLHYRQPQRPERPVAEKSNGSREKQVIIEKKVQKKKNKIEFKKKIQAGPRKKERQPRPDKNLQPETLQKSPHDFKDLKLLEPESFQKQEASPMSHEEMDFSSIMVKEKDLALPLKGAGDMASAPSTQIQREALPLYKKNPHPEYSKMARRRGYQGTVVLEVLVNQEGKVSDLRLFQSSGHTILDRAAMVSVKKWLFEPGSRGDQKVNMWVKVPICFKLR